MRRVVLLAAAVGLILGGYAAMQRFTRHTPAASNLPLAPALSLSDVNGAAIETANYQGKVVLVNFWAAWCEPCADEVPQFIALQKKYQAQGLQVLSFSVDDDRQDLLSFYRKYQMNYPAVPSDIRIADAYGGVLGLPTTLVIGRDNRIHGKHNGATDFAALEQEVVALLHSPQG